MKILAATYSALLCVGITTTSSAQDAPATLVIDLPDSPGALQQPQSPAEVVVGNAQVSGTVVDVQGDPIPGAKVTLRARGRLDDKVVTTAQDGSYTFSNLSASPFRVVVTAASFAPGFSPEFTVHAGENAAAPRVILTINSTSSVNVVATQDQVATEEVREQEHQRVFGVFPNFYTSYIWKVAPMTTGLKFKLAGRSLIDPFAILIVSATAGAEQFNNTYPDYGPGIAGYGKRFGAAYADSATERMVGSAILPTLLHQDPRYFYQGSGGIRSRALHAIGSTFLTRSDKGTTQINFSHLGGGLAAGAVANAYHPPASRGVGLTFETFGITTGANMIGNLVREFVLRSLEPSVPVFARGRKP